MLINGWFIGQLANDSQKEMVQNQIRTNSDVSLNDIMTEKSSLETSFIDGKYRYKGNKLNLLQSSNCDT